MTNMNSEQRPPARTRAPTIPITSGGGGGRNTLMTSPLSSSASQARRKIFGFTLVETMIVMVILGVIASGAFQVMTAMNKKMNVEQTQGRLHDIRLALAQHVAEHGYLPCPADPTIPIGQPGYGASAALDCKDVPDGNIVRVRGARNSLGACPATGTGNCVHIGALPVNELGLTGDHMKDKYHGLYTYAVTQTLARGRLVTVTVNGQPTEVRRAIPGTYNKDAGSIDIVEQGNASALQPSGSALYAVVSHGEDGLGARTPQGGLAADCDATPPVRDLENCDGDATFRVINERTTQPGPQHFDDFVISSVTLTGELPDRIANCGNKGMIFGDQHPQRDAEGCVPNMIEAGNGNVGIGTGNPVGDLQIGKATKLGVDEFLLGNTTAGEKGIRIHYNNDSSGGSYERAVIDVRAKDFSIRGVAPSVAGDASVERLFIDLASGNVGIGTADPRGQLHISTTSAAPNTSPYGIVLENNLAGLANRHGIGTAYDGTFRIKRLASPFESDLTIAPNGNVGIGPTATNPQARLDVQGNIHATQDICTDAAGGKCLSTAGGAGGGGPATITGGTCPVGSYVSGISSTGVPTCTLLPPSITGGTCPAGQIMTGISSTGTPVCAIHTPLYQCPVFSGYCGGAGSTCNGQITTSATCYYDDSGCVGGAFSQSFNCTQIQ